MTEPLISILIPVYNAAEYLRSSVKSILFQTYTNMEILIIDDGSTDECMASIANLNDSRIHIITQENTGKSAAINNALQAVKGKYYCIQDADDISHPNRIKRQVECMEANPELAAVFTGHNIILNKRRLAPRFSGKNIEQCRNDIEQMRMPAHDPTGMFRMSMVSKLRYDPALRIGQGVDYILRVGEMCPMVVLGECLYSYRIHFNSSTTTDITMRKQMVRKVLERAYKRRGLDPSEDILSDKPSPQSRFKHREKEASIVPHFMESVLDLCRTGRRLEAMKTALACLQLHPYDPYYYKPLVYSITPAALIRYYRSTVKGGFK